MIQPAGIIFKGSGFYVNDNNKANNPASPSAANGDDKSAGDKEQSAKKTETKSETKAEKKPEAKTPAAASS